MITRIVSAVSLIALLIGGTAPAYSAGSSEEQDVEIEFWHEWSPGNPQDVTLNEMLSDFSEDHENITVTPVYMGKSAEEKISSALAAGNPPEIIWIDSIGANYYEEDLLIPMERVWERVDRDDIFPTLLEESQYFGEDISLPFEVSNLAVLHNTRMLEEGGVQPPSQELGEQWTFDEFIAAAREFTDVDNDQYGWEPRPNSDHAEIIFYQLGGQFFSDDFRTNLIVEDPEMRDLMIQSLEVIERMFVTEQIAPVPKDDQRFGNFDMPTEITGPWDIARNAQEPFGQGKHPIDELAVSPYPLIHEDAPSVTLWYQKALALFKTDELREEATLEFIEWFYSPENFARWAAEGSYLPVSRGSAEHPIWQEHVEQVPQMQVYLDQLSTMRFPVYETHIPDGGVGEMVDAVMLGEMSPEAAVEMYVQNAQVALDQYWERLDR